MAQVVEHVLGKDEVTSSNLVNSSKILLSFPDGGIFLFLHENACPPLSGKAGRFQRLSQKPEVLEPVRRQLRPLCGVGDVFDLILPVVQPLAMGAALEEVEGEGDAEH